MSPCLPPNQHNKLIHCVDCSFQCASFPALPLSSSATREMPKMPCTISTGALSWVSASLSSLPVRPEASAALMVPRRRAEVGLARLPVASAVSPIFVRIGVFLSADQNWAWLMQ